VQIYLPIADLPVNVFVILAMGLAVGFISGMFGIGGGFLMTPLLIFLGISPAVAVASVTGHIAASSMSGASSYWRRRAIDLALAFMLLAGGIVGYRISQALATHQVSIGPGDLLVIATDGILEDHVADIDFALPAMAIAEHILNAYSRESDDALALAARHRGASS